MFRVGPVTMTMTVVMEQMKERNVIHNTNSVQSKNSLVRTSSVFNSLITVMERTTVVTILMSLTVVSCLCPTTFVIILSKLSNQAIAFLVPVFFPDFFSTQVYTSQVRWSVLNINGRTKHDYIIFNIAIETFMRFELWFDCGTFKSGSRA